MKLSKKHLQTHLRIYLLFGGVLIGMILLISNIYLEAINLRVPTKIGVSFSPAYARELGLNPKDVFNAALNDLHIKAVRLNAYWDEIEGEENKFDFYELDYYLDEAAKRNIQVYLAVGYKLPRWPECRAPKWVDSQNTQVRQANQLRYVEAVITRYNSNPAIKAFQIENEPLLDFGICPKTDREFLQKEVTFVRTKTPKPLILTDSGELRAWITPMQLSDIFGTTMYRVVDAPLLGKSFYPLQPWYYRVKSNLIRAVFAPKNQKTIIAELQAETWSDRPLVETPINEQISNYSLSQFQDSLKFAQRTGFDEIYLWGVEWWYFLDQRGHPEYLEYAKSLF